MNVQRLSGSLLDNAAPLTSIVVSLSSSGRLLFPVWPTVINMTSKPNRAIFPGVIAGFPLPSGAAFDAAKVMLAHLAWASFNHLTAGVTNHTYSIVLRMIGAARCVFSPPSNVTFSVAKVMLQAFYAVLFVLRQLTAVVTRRSHTLGSGSITAGERTILLLGVVARRLKRLAAMLARLGNVCTPGFVGTSNRAESYYSVRSFFDWFSAVFTEFIHSSIIAQR